MDPSRRVWHLSERGTLYLCIACKWNPSKGVWHPSERGTIYHLYHLYNSATVTCKCINGIPHEDFGISLQKDMPFTQTLFQK